MKQTITTFALSAMLLALCFPAEALQPAKIPRIGFLSVTSLSIISARIEALRQGLRELGYVEGKNIVIEWRSAEGKLDRVPALAAELVRSQGRCDRHGWSVRYRVLPRKRRTRFPLSWRRIADPVESGFVASLARPGGNITGLSNLAPEVSGKRLELLKEIVPKVSRVAVLGTSTRPGNAQSLKEVELAAGAFKVQVQYLDVLDVKDIETAFRAATKERAEAVLVLQSPSPFLSDHKL